MKNIKETYKFLVDKTDVDRDLTEKIREQLKFNSDGKCINAFEIISNIGTLVDAYETIKNKSGNMVPGTDEETLDGISKE